MFSVFFLKAPTEFWNLYSDLSIHNTLSLDLVDIKIDSQHAVKKVLDLVKKWKILEFRGIFPY